MAGDAKAIFDLAAFDRQTGGDAGLRSEIIQMFLEDCPLRAAEIRDAVAKGDAPALKAAAHSLKGSAAYMSASIVRGHAGDLERMGREGELDEAQASVDALDAAVAVLLPGLQKLLG